MLGVIRIGGGARGERTRWRRGRRMRNRERKRSRSTGIEEKNKSKNKKECLLDLIFFRIEHGRIFSHLFRTEILFVSLQCCNWTD